MYKFKVFVLLLFPFTMVSQNITGKVYDAETTVKGAKIFNKNKNTTTHTDETGTFKIIASIADTLVFTSLFHEEKALKITNSHFGNTIVIEIKKIINTLDEVLLANEKLKEFNEEIYTNNLGSQIQNDIKNNPHLYSASQSGNLDFVKIISLISKLFKNKKVKDVPIKAITHKAFDSLFSKDKLFNDKLLADDLKIPEAYNPLFFDYCEAQNIDSKLLLEENKFILLDELFKCSHDFLVILDDYKSNYLKD